MKTKFIEASQDKEKGFNWGKFLVMKFSDSEFEYMSMMDPRYRLLPSIGWRQSHIWVMDLQTCEGAAFQPGGLPGADLEKHAVWVCPMFSPFLAWLYKQDLSDLDKLPGLVELPKAPVAIAGYRRAGPKDAQEKPVRKKKRGKK